MSPDEIKLACLLAGYELDEPWWNDGRDCIPGVSSETFLAWLRHAHDGDCVDQSVSCRRCFAEHVRHKAKWLNERMGK